MYWLLNTIKDMLWKTNSTYGLRKEKSKDSIDLIGICLQKTTKNNKSLNHTALCLLKLAGVWQGIQGVLLHHGYLSESGRGGTRESTGLNLIFLLTPNDQYNSNTTTDCHVFQMGIIILLENPRGPAGYSNISKISDSQ